MAFGDAGAGPELHDPVWRDAPDRLPYVTVSRDHGRTWSTPMMVAPPGVDEVTSRRSTAGDAGRIAITCPGTQVANRDDETRPWNQYELLSLNALDSAPLFTWTTANEPADPIHWRDCGPGRCGRMFDFLDIQTSPFDGTLWATASDTCLGDCVGPSLWQPARREQR